MTDEMRSSPAQLSHAQQEALKVLAATAKRGCVELSFVEGELSKLDEFTRLAVRRELATFFDAIVELAPGESREPLPGLTLTRPNARARGTEVRTVEE